MLSKTLKRLAFTALCLTPILSFGQGQTCATAEIITTNGAYNATGPNAGAGCNDCTDGATNASWYTFTPAADGFLSVSSCAFFGPQTRLWLYEGACGSLSQIAADSSYACAGLFSQGSLIEISLTAGNSYFLEWDDANASADFTFNFDYDTSGCFKPSELNVDTITPTSATLNWTSLNAGNKFYVEYGPFFFAQGTGTLDSGLVGIDGPPFTITGLDPNSLYDIYLWEKCSDTTTTDTVQFDFIFTPDNCPAPNAASFAVDSIAKDYARIIWDGANTGSLFYFEYGVAGFAQGTGTPITGTVGTDGPPVELSGLAEGVDYDYYYYEACSEAVGFTDTIFGEFTTLSDCNAPVAVVVANQTENSVDVDWTTFNDSSRFTIEYGPVGFTPGSGTSVSDTIINKPVTLDFLSSGTTYEAYVFETCANVSGTTDSVYFSFSTLINNDSCAQAVTLMCGSLVSGSLSGATANDNPDNNCDGVFSFGAGAWYEFQGTGEVLNLNACSDNFNPLLYVYTGTCGALDCFMASDAGGTCAGSGSFLSFTTELDTMYYIQVRTQFGAAADFTISAECIAACTDTIVNNDCANAEAIALSPQLNCAFTSGDLQCATPSGLNAVCDFLSTSTDAWYTFNTDTNTAVKITINDLDLAGLSYGVYSGCSIINTVTCGDLVDSNFVVLTGLTANTDYYIQIYNTAVTGGTFEVCVQPETTVGINEYAAINASLAPNPTKDVFTINVSQAVTLNILSITGKLMHTQEVNGTAKINLSAYASGVYLVELKAANTHKVLRVIKE